MINRVISRDLNSIAAKYRAATNTPGMTYKVSGGSWFDKFEVKDENNIISSLINKINGGTFNCKHYDGLNYEFVAKNGDKISYVKNSKGMMANITYKPINASEQGFYMIDNERSSESSRKFRELSSLFDQIIGKSKVVNNTPSRILKSTQTHILKEQRTERIMLRDQRQMKEYQSLKNLYRTQTVSPSRAYATATPVNTYQNPPNYRSFPVARPTAAQRPSQYAWSA